MSETTQILFNSPALHSLKRDQLVKLCKIHSIKASGKKVELIEKLKQHASTLPHSDPLSVATRSEQPEDDKDLQGDRSRLDTQRPSDQWEVVMEDIPELPENSSRGTDEFGTGGGSKSSSVTSSLRAIANTFNFKRPTPNKLDNVGAMFTSSPTKPDTTDELATHSVPYSSIPEPSPADMPQTDHFKFSTPDTTLELEDQFTGQPGCSGIPAQANAPLGGTSSPMKTTIRLVSASNSVSTLPTEPGTPHLRPVDPAFDLVMNSPDAKGQSRVPVWPLSPQAGFPERMYPALPADELDQAKKGKEKAAIPPSVGSASKSKAYPTPSNDVQDLFSPARKPQKEREGIPHSEPFLFGSPLPRHNVSNKAFDAAATSVLEEMNKRLSAAGAQKVGADLFGGSAIATVQKTDSGSLRGRGNVDRFDKAHEEQFNKMDSIATHYAAKRGAPESKKRKSEVLGHGSAPARKRSSADTRVISAGPRRRMGIPGGFADDEDEADDAQEEGDRRMSKRVRVLEEDGGKDKGRRLTISPKKTEAEEKQAEKERATTRKMLEARKEKRRSSRHVSRMNAAGPQAASNKGKATPRFGFLSSAKSIVCSVWNFGAGSPTKASRISAATAASKSKSVNGGAAGEPKQAKQVAPPRKPSLPTSRPSEGPAGKKGVVPTITRSGSSNQAASTRSRQSVRGVSRSSTAPFSTQRSGGVPTAKPAHVVVPDESGSTAEGNGGNNKASVLSPSGTMSRLLAPTASSLAKSRCPVNTTVTSTGIVKSKTGSIVAQRAKSPPRNSVLDAITNSPRNGNANSPPSGSTTTTGGKIFTMPLQLLTSPKQVIPPPVKPTSLTAAATALAAAAAATATGDLSSQQSSPNRRGPLATPGPSSTSRPGQLSSTRKPRISRSRIIAKLGAHRAVSTATSSSSHSTTATATATATVSGTSRIPRASGSSAVRSPRVRSSLGTAARRSYAGTKSASRGSDVLMSAKKHARQSEYVRRRSRAAGSAAGAARASEADGSMAMDIDCD